MIRLSLILLAAAAGCMPRVAGVGGPQIRVATWNIQAGGSGLDSIAKLIDAMEPDIIALQEVDVHWSGRSNFVNQARALAEQTNMEVRFAPIYSLPADSGRPPREFGVAILTRFRIVQWRNDSLTRLSTQAPNAQPTRMPGLLDMTVDAHGKRIRVLTTHLDYRPDPAVRRQQVQEILRALDGSREPVLVMGDLNATPDAPELRPLLEGLHDAWMLPESDGLTYPADRPTKRIDYILTSSHFSVEQVQSFAFTVADHRPVVAQIRVR